MGIPEKYLDEKGNIRPIRETLAIRQQALDKSRQEAEHRQRTQLEAMPDLDRRLRQMQQQRAEADRNDDRSRVEMYDRKIREIKEEKVVSEKKVAFDNDPYTRNVLEGRDSLSRSGTALYDYPESKADIDLAVSIIDGRHEFGSVQEFTAAHSAAMDTIVSKNLHHRRHVAGELTLAALKSEVDAAQAAVKLSEAQLSAVQQGSDHDPN